MRVRGFLVACLLAVGTSVYGQEPVDDKKDQEIAELKKQAAEQNKKIDALVGAVSQMPKPAPPTAEQQKQTLREQYTKVFKSVRENAADACKDAGGKRFSVIIDSAGKPGASCEF
jgi:hypothetical protein